MVAEMLVWGFFSAMGFMAATWTVEKVIPEKPKQEETQICSKWEERDNGDGTRTKSRTCNFLKD